MSYFKYNHSRKIAPRLPTLVLWLAAIVILPAWIIGQEPAPVSPQEPAPEPVYQLSPDQIEKIETFVANQMRLGKMPGLSVVLVRGSQTLYKKGFGFADRKTREPVTPATLFELGSTSKAFTALGVLLLQRRGLISLDDPVDRYIHWLKFKYRGKEVPVSIHQLLHQSSGIPFNTIGTIPPLEGDDALDLTVKTLRGQSLAHQPGQKFLYATINYDVLGLLIQTLSGESYEDYMKEKVLLPLGLTSTYLTRKEALERGLAQGYKLFFKKPLAYRAPYYRGNVPAGYVITNGDDLERWLKIQLGTIEPEGFPLELISKTHERDPQLPDSPYGMGWFVLPGRADILHGGQNPNYASLFILNPDLELGIGVLANLNSDFVGETGLGILAILMGREPRISAGDFNAKMDNASTLILIAGIPLLILAFILFCILVGRIIRKQRQYRRRGPIGIITAISVSLLFLAFVYLIFSFPTLIGYAVPWSFVTVWQPATLSMAAITLVSLIFFLYLYFLFRFFTLPVAARQ